MLSFTEAALRKDLEKEGYVKVLKSLKEDQESMIELSNSLLLLSQYEKIQFSKQWPLIRIDELLYETIGIARKMLPNIDIELEFMGLPSDENALMIHANDALLKVAFTNLFKNAWLYSTDKKVTVLIDADEGKLDVHVDNTGKQLQQGEIEKLQVPFFRGANSASIKGFGLGLSIVHRIVSIHQASFSYTALPPDINRFSIHFHQESA
jgi:signal transduction histidine kinase